MRTKAMRVSPGIVAFCAYCLSEHFCTKGAQRQFLPICIALLLLLVVVVLLLLMF